MALNNEIYISVDVETAGPYPDRYALLSIGACRVDDPQQAFYVELQPTSMEFLPSALSVCRLDLDRLAEHGAPPAEALRNFAAWVERQVRDDSRAVFVAFNAVFDWMFLNEYFYRFLGRNPFGHSAIDMKAFHMGLAGVAWGETSLQTVAAYHGISCILTHHALEDAQVQAGLFQRMMARRQG
jgi:DNA polymerase III epsilon subunit-like protein